ncbi:MAG TPA: ABC transporter permease [Solirubrobacteraceae bacterium]|nr:ABC transporter permease [Solirubrobacteraceae bacterium]
MSVDSVRFPRRVKRRRPPKPPAAEAARLPPHELLAVALQGLGTRRLRAALSALGIAIGIGAMVAVVGVSASSQANLLATIDSLGTNLLTVSPGTTFFGANEVLPSTAVGTILHQPGVQRASAVYQVSSATVLRTPYVPSEQTGGIGVDATDPGLLGAVSGQLASGQFLSARNENFPTVVLGAQAASILQIPNASGHIQLYLGGTWFTVVGIMKPVILDPNLDSTVFIGLPVAERLFQTQANASEIYVRANVNDVTSVSGLLAPATDPQNPDGVQVSRPSDVLEARAAAKGQFTTLLLGLGAVALLVGAIGIANIMVISVLERRGEIGLRRALGATKRHISIQFLSESALLAALGGVAGLALGALATLVYALAQNQPWVVPTYALIAAPAAGFAIGALAGVYPAAKAARLSPTEALRTS